jgi:steroid delta-isomerase-like uncharacterized protein
MNPIEVFQRSMDAWNRHDADAVLAAYAEGATYSHPRPGENLSREAMGNFVKAVWAAYPDARLETISTGDTGGGLVATQWVFHGTNTGTLPDGTPATGRTVAQPGASFAQFEGDKIRSERVYVDMHNLFEQLGLKAKQALEPAGIPG